MIPRRFILELEILFWKIFFFSLVSFYLNYLNICHRTCVRPVTITVESCSCFSSTASTIRYHVHLILVWLSESSIMRLAYLSTYFRPFYLLLQIMFHESLWWHSALKVYACTSTAVHPYWLILLTRPFLSRGQPTGRVLVMMSSGGCLNHHHHHQHQHGPKNSHVKWTFVLRAITCWLPRRSRTRALVVVL